MPLYPYKPREHSPDKRGTHIPHNGWKSSVETQLRGSSWPRFIEREAKKGGMDRAGVAVRVGPKEVHSFVHMRANL